jgi:hypothetical protein
MIVAMFSMLTHIFSIVFLLSLARVKSLSTAVTGSVQTRINTLQSKVDTFSFFYGMLIFSLIECGLIMQRLAVAFIYKSKTVTRRNQQTSKSEIDLDSPLAWVVMSGRLLNTLAPSRDGQQNQSLAGSL